MVATQTAGYTGLLKIGVAANPTNIMADLPDAQFQGKMDMYETTALNSSSGAKTFIPGLFGGTVQLKMTWDYGDTTGQKVLQDAFFARTLLFFIFSPNAGTNTITFTAYVSDYQVHSPVNNKVDSSATLQITGAAVAA